MTADGPVQFTSISVEEMESEAALRSLLQQAAEYDASDLCFLTDEREVSIWMRHWGRMKRMGGVSHAKGQQLISAVKAKAEMDIAEKRRPLDGRFVQRLASRHIDLRVSSIPTLHGEDLSMRILDRNVGLRSLAGLGFSEGDLDKLLAMLNSPGGLILVSGPTGTGKTTTLYACLQYLNNGERKINTLEDPIEYAVEGLRQSQVQPRLGLDFADLLRSVLRQAPDVIMIGEIRDEETAKTAVRAANSGHLVFATLHSPMAAGAVQSMMTLGENPHFLASGLLGVIAQRLVRKLCSHCRIEHDLLQSPQTFADVQDLLAADQGGVFCAPGGCDRCRGEGYVGRTGLFEVMLINRRLRDVISASRPSSEIEQAAIDAGMIEFRRAALISVAQGRTSMEEVLSAVPAEFLGLDD